MIPHVEFSTAVVQIFFVRNISSHAPKRFNPLPLTVPPADDALGRFIRFAFLLSLKLLLPLSLLFHYCKARSVVVSVEHGIYPRLISGIISVSHQTKRQWVGKMKS